MACTTFMTTALLGAAASAQTTPPEPGPPAPAAAQAQNAPAPAGPAPADAAEEGGLQEIVVTAQRREQLLQDVPVAVTALSQDTLQANRVVNVSDLSGLAPNVVVRPSAGGVGLPSFSMRGLVSYGVVAGSDKQVSIYVDGVYLGSPRGSIFDLPDIQRIEVLRGPQGTLFGRNATAGAVSVVTRDPTGVFHARQEVTIGNYDQLRTRTSVDLPAFGAFSGYVSYVHNERRGDIRNLGAGTTWNRTGPQTGLGIQRSPRYLGNKNSESVFAALRFQPNDDFDNVYKFSHTNERGSPEGVAFLGVNPNTPLIGSLLTTLIASQPTPVLVDTEGRRPKAVNNSWASDNRVRVTGHTLTSRLRISDAFSATNIAAFRKSYVNSSSQIDGLGGLVLTPQALAPYATFVAFSSVPGLAGATPAVQGATIGAIAQRLAPAVGSPFQVINSTAQSRSRQWSDEFQLNYTSDLVDVTAGGLYFHSKDRAGGPPGLPNSIAFAPVPGFAVPLGNEATSFNKATSIAGYLRAELHVTETIDVIGGARLTRDRKSGSFVRGGTFVPVTPGSREGTFVNQQRFDFTFRDTRPSYEAGVNYKPNRNLLVYGKYSTAFVTGGSVAGIAFEPETVRSFEGGVKADLFGRRLRTNLAVFDARYKNLQSAQSGSVLRPARPELPSVIVELGDAHARGFEFEATALPTDGLTLGGSLGFTDVEFRNVNPVLVTAAGGTRFLPTYIPRWTYTLSAQYETQPVFGETTALFRVDANGRAKQRTDPNPDSTLPYADPLRFSRAQVIVNARAALRKLQLGAVEGEIGLWGRNLNNNRATAFTLSFGNLLASATYQPARTYGADLIVNF